MAGAIVVVVAVGIATYTGESNMKQNAIKGLGGDMFEEIAIAAILFLACCAMTIGVIGACRGFA